MKKFTLMILFWTAALAGSLSLELLRNGDVESGTPEERGTENFMVQGWRRELWNPTTIKSWLTSGEYDTRAGAGNQSLLFSWGATSIYQHFSAAANNEYAFKADCMLTGKDTRWEPRIRVEWFNAAGVRIGNETVVAQIEKENTKPQQWISLEGEATAPAGTAYGRILLDVENCGSGQYFQRQLIDNVSVTGEPGTDNLPVSFMSAPYDMNMAAIHEQDTFSGILTDYADDGDGDRLVFSKLNGPEWLKVKPDGSFSGTPKFADVGESVFKLRAEDGKGSSDTRTLTIPVIGLLRFAHVFNHNMVLQRDHEISVWGVAIPDLWVNVRLGKARATAKADAEGKWSVKLPAMETGGPLELAVASGPRTVVLKNIMLGDVWMCCGQSNMSWPLKNTDGAAEEIANASHANLRFTTTPLEQAAGARDELMFRADWHVSLQQTVSEFSAIGYYFGKQLQKDLNIPIGLISANQGGTPIETWTRGLNKPDKKILYNAMVHPFTRMPIKGMIWYQAEANIRDGAAYTAKMELLAKEWRATWGIGDFPIYYVQLAPFNYKGDDVHQLPKMWVAQAAAMKSIPSSGMVVVNDIGNVENIHPTNKAPVGERLARWAKHGTYGQKNILPCGPVFHSMRSERGFCMPKSNDHRERQSLEKEGNVLRIRFDYAGKGLVARDGKPLSWFEVAGADGEFKKADAKIDGDSVVVSTSDIQQPRRIRFAWHETAEPNLMNSEGLPAGAFEAETK